MFLSPLSNIPLGTPLEDQYVEMYSRQILVEGIGVKGQAALRRSRVAVVGAGATGSAVAEMLVRAGVGFIRVVDRDVVDLSNIPRCHLLEYSDYLERKPKALAIAEKISRISPYTEVEPVVVNVDGESVHDVVKDVDLVVDALDNMEAKHLLNEASVMHGKPYIYIGVEGVYGMVLPVIPGRTPCLRCVAREISAAPAGCDVIGTHIIAVTMVSSIAASLAIKILMGRPLEGVLYYVDASLPEVVALKVRRDDRCPVCSLKNFEMLSRKKGAEVSEVCGTPGAYIADPSILGSIDISKWSVEKRAHSTIYRRGGIEIIAFDRHLLVLARGVRRADELLKQLKSS